MLCTPHLLPTIKRRARFDHLLLWLISASVTGAVPAAAQSSRLLYVYEDKTPQTLKTTITTKAPPD